MEHARNASEVLSCTLDPVLRLKAGERAIAASQWPGRTCGQCIHATHANIMACASSLPAEVVKYLWCASRNLSLNLRFSKLPRGPHCMYHSDRRTRTSHICPVTINFFHHSVCPLSWLIPMPCASKRTAARSLQAMASIGGEVEQGAHLSQQSRSIICLFYEVTWLFCGQISLIGRYTTICLAHILPP